MNYSYCDTPRSCQLEQCIPGVQCRAPSRPQPLHHHQPRPCTCCDCASTHGPSAPRISQNYDQSEMYLPMDFQSASRAQDFPMFAPSRGSCYMSQCQSSGMGGMCHPMSSQQQQQPQCLPQMPMMPPQTSNGGWKKSPCGISLDTLNSPTRFLPECMVLPGQPISPQRDGMCMPFVPGGMEPQQSNQGGCCRPRCMKFM